MVRRLQEKRRQLCHVHLQKHVQPGEGHQCLDLYLDPIFVNCDHSLHSWRVGERKEKGLAVDFMDEVDIVPGAIEHLPDKGPFQARPCQVLGVGEGWEGAILALG